MALNQINAGSSPNDGTGTPLRTAAGYINAIITSMWDTVTGGIAYLGGKVGIGTSSPGADLDIIGSSGVPGIGLRVLSDVNATDIVFHFKGGVSESTHMIMYQPGTVYIGKVSGGSNFGIEGLPVYANNAAALVGGLTSGDFYKTASTGDAQVMVVNAT